MYLGLRTDSPLAEFYLHLADGRLVTKSWQADRQLARDVLSQLEAFLREHDTQFKDVQGLFVYQGPGSFTGLRIGVTVMNTLSYALGVPIVGEKGDMWAEGAARRLAENQNDTIVLPFYGAEPRITVPKK